MKVRQQLDSIEVEVEGRDTKECFTSLAHAVEIFSKTKCGACESTKCYPRIRTVGTDVYHEMFCPDCGASLAFGTKKSDGTLFPKKKDKQGQWLEHNGWVKWTKQAAEAEPF